MQREGQSSNNESLPTVSLQVETISLQPVPGDRSPRLDRKSNRKEPITNDDLKPGELICDKCNGERWLEGTGKKSDWLYQCDKCQGDGKVDWISHIMGVAPKPPRKLKGDWSMELEQDLNAMYGTDLHKEIVDYLGKELAEKVDEEIMENLIDISVTKSKLK